MADTRAVIEIETRDDGGPKKSTERVNELGDHAAKTAAKLKLLGTAAGGTSRKLLGLASAATAAGVAMSALNKRQDVLMRVMYSGTKMLRTFGGVLSKFLTGGLKLATVALGAMSVALVGICLLYTSPSPRD